MNDFFLPKREKDTHKGHYGHVLIIAGSRGMSGAAALCAQAALRSGAGLVTVGVPRQIAGIVACRVPEAMVYPLPQTRAGTVAQAARKIIRELLRRATVLAIGPGLSRNPQTALLVRGLVRGITVPLVLDADGIVAFAGHRRMLAGIPQGSIMTPHPGELARLCAIRVSDVIADRKGLAKDFFAQYNITLVLKGHRTIVASGPGTVYTNRTGNPGMATGGSGDVLTGVIAGLLAQGIQPGTAARLGVYVHGRAGDRAARHKGEISLIASDILEELPAVFTRLIR